MKYGCSGFNVGGHSLYLSDKELAAKSIGNFYGFMLTAIVPSMLIGMGMGI